MNFAASLIALQAMNPILVYLHRQTDPQLNPFRGLYQANAFDLTMMIPYFIVLGILALYGMHRYWLVYEYFKYRRNVPEKPPEPADWPKVRSNAGGLSYFVFRDLNDTLRRVSEHVTIGEAWRNGKNLHQYFILVRRD